MSVASTEQAIVRFADAVGQLNPRRSGRIVSIGEMPEVKAFAAVLAIPNGQDWEAGECNRCRAQMQVRRVGSWVVCPESVACEACIQRHRDEERLRHHQQYWEHVCPEQFRTTDKAPQGLPGGPVRRAQEERPEAVPVLLRPHRHRQDQGVAMLDAEKRALLRDQRVGVLWPGKLGTLQAATSTPSRSTGTLGMTTC